MLTPAEVVEQHYTALRARDWERLESLLSRDVEYRDPDVEQRGRAALLDRAMQLEAPYSEVTIDTRLVQGDDRIVVAEWTYAGTNHGPLTLRGGTQLPATGRRIFVRGLSLFEVRDGVIVAEHTYWDNAALYGQLGLLPDPALAGSW